MDGLTKTLFCAFKAYGWNVIDGIDVHDPELSLQPCVKRTKKPNDPRSWSAKTTIGFGSPSFAGTSRTHGRPLGLKNASVTRDHLQWPYAALRIPENITRSMGCPRPRRRNVLRLGKKCGKPTNNNFLSLRWYLQNAMTQKTPSDWQQLCQSFCLELQKEAPNIATRKASQRCLQFFAEKIPFLIGGSADLTESNLTHWTQSASFYSRKIFWPLHFLRCSRICHERDPQWTHLHGVRQSLRWNFSHLFRLRAQCGAHGRFDEDPKHFCVHPRFYRLGRRRTHAPTGGAFGVSTLDSSPRRYGVPAMLLKVRSHGSVPLKTKALPVFFSRQNCTTQPRSTQQIEAIRHGAYILFETDPEPENYPSWPQAQKLGWRCKQP